MSFNPRAREGRDLLWYTTLEDVGICFNPRAREGRDDHGNASIDTGFLVSIHAPARGATQERPSGRGWYSFNPRAREGRDLMKMIFQRMSLGFNPRAREGRDVTPGSCRICLLFQSTRPRGARLPDMFMNEVRLDGFNPRAREGRDPEPEGVVTMADKFQSTRPRGARRQGYCRN